MKLMQLNGCILYETNSKQNYNIIYCENFNEIVRNKSINKLLMVNIPSENNLQYKLLKKSPEFIFVNGQIHSTSLYNLFKKRDTAWIFEITYLYSLIITRKYELIKLIKGMYRRILRSKAVFYVWSFKPISQSALSYAFLYFMNEKEQTSKV